MSAREKAGLGAALAAALLVRVLLVLSLRGQPYFDTPIVDSASFDRRAVAIVSGTPSGGVYFQDPLYAYLLAGFYAAFGRDFLAVRLAQSVLAVGGLWMLFEAVRRLWGYRAGLAALLIGAFTKTLCFFDAMVLKDFLGVIALEGALLCFTLEGRKRWILTGLCLGLGALVRGNLLLALPAAAAFAWAASGRRAALEFAAGTLLAVLPATIRNAAATGEFVPVTAHAGVNLYIGNNPENTSGRYRPPSFLTAASPEAEERDFREEASRRLRRQVSQAEADRYWRGEALDWIASNPGVFLATTLKRVAMLVSSHEIPDDHDPYFMARFSWVLGLPLFTFGLFLLPLAAAGVYLSWMERPRPVFPLLLAGVIAASISLFFIFGRYRLPLYPVLLAFAGVALDRFPRLLGVGMTAIPKTAAGIFLAVLVLSNLPLPAAIGGHRDFRTAHRNLGLWYLEQDRPREAAAEFEAASKLNPAYLADPAFLWTLGGAWEKAGDAARAAERYGDAARLDPVSPEAPYRAGMIYFHEGMHARAEAAFAEALRRDPAFRAAIVPLASSLRTLRKPGDAKDLLDAAIERHPADASLRVARGELYLDLSMWKAAEAEAEEALRRSPADAAARRLQDAARRRSR